MKCLFSTEFQRAASIRKIAVYRFLISLQAAELQRFKDEYFQIKKVVKNSVEINQNRLFGFQILIVSASLKCK